MDDLLVIPDLSADPRTSRNPLVVEEATYPLLCRRALADAERAGDGEPLRDRPHAAPRRPDPTEADGLRRLARQVMILLRERAQVSKLQAAEAAATAMAERSTALVRLADTLRDATSIPQIVEKAARSSARRCRPLAPALPNWMDRPDAQRARALGAGRRGRGAPVSPGRFRRARRAGGAGGKGRHFGRAGRRPSRGARPDACPCGIRSILNVPIQERGRSVGLVYVHCDQPRTWLADEEDFARNVADRVQVAVARVRAEAHQETLNRELSHRMKNLLAMVQAIAAQTLRRGGTLEAAREALSKRLFAMGEAHDLLLRGQGEATTLEAVVKNALLMHEDGRSGQLTLSGPPCGWARNRPCPSC